MSADPYAILGVAKSAPQDEIQKAYRRLAKKLHPDLNPGNDKAEEAFKEVTRAYGVLGDAAKRKRFDDGEIDEQGAERPKQPYYRDFPDHEQNPYANASAYADLGDDDEFLSEIFGRATAEGRGAFKVRGSDARYNLSVPFLDAVNGAQTQITLPDGSALDVAIPAGVRDGQVLRLRGKGRPGHGGGSPGDALIELQVGSHPVFTRKDDDIHVETAISLRDAVLGGGINVATPTGLVSMTVPPWSNTGVVLRLKGKGVANRAGVRGDEYVTLKVTLPDRPDPALQAFIRDWRPEGVARPHSASED